MSLTEIAGHKFTEGLMRDRCSRCEVRWADAVANRVACNGYTMTDHYNAQYDEARQEMWNAVLGTCAGNTPLPAAAIEEPDASPYCFSWGNVEIGRCQVPEVMTFGFPASLSWEEILELLDGRP